MFHVHDEVIIEARNDGSQSLETVEDVFRTPIPWAPELPLKGGGVYDALLFERLKLAVFKT